MTDTVIDTICDSLARLTPDTTASLTVAFSGGVDSTVLLVAAKSFAAKRNLSLSACYIHHGLSENATAWQRHCADICERLNIDFEAKSVEVATTPRESTEAIARTARYTALVEHCRQRQSALLLGQHQDDQLETVLLQLKRGAGPQGLAAMPQIQVRNGVVMLRPMLGISRKQIEQSARDLALPWVEDESNADTAYDRNFLRKQIIPLLQSRWPSISETASRSASLCADQQELVKQAAAEKLEQVRKGPGQLDGEKLTALPEIWQRAILRQWFAQHETLPPSRAQLEQILLQLTGKSDAQPQIEIEDVVLRRFQNDLYWTRKTAVPQAVSEQLIQAGTVTYLEAFALNLSVSARTDNTQFRVVPVSLNEKVKPQGESVSKPIKQWMKARGIPPWQRQPAALLLMDSAPVACIIPAGLISLQALPSDVQLSAS